MSLLGRVTGGIDDDELILIFGWTFNRLPLKSLLDSIGDDVRLRMEMVDLLKEVVDELRGIMDGIDFGEQRTIEPGIDQLIGWIEVLEFQMIGEVLGLGMEGGRAGNAKGMGVVAGFAREHPAEIEMDDVAAFKGFLQRAQILARSRADAIGGDIMGEDAEIDCRDHIVTRLADLILIGADDSDFVPFGTKRTNDVHGGDRGAVVFLS